ncbi:histidine kinase [Nonomuraea phyllanthi]|uniref:sensor histidine kinase n=1 Tax=Nonomuraea phyllanthi TaxID=2219224 RepID=UPI001293A395|nr:histidine kinase [Nonomuraea phyllanthi]QFY09011.1 histidine kinase [Nonomuraea phyllanthi]
MRKNLPRRWACLVLGGALLMPYMMTGVVVTAQWQGQQANLLLPVQLGVFVAVLPVVAVTGLFLPVRALEVNAAQGLLGAHVETPPRQAGRSWQERRRTAAWFTLHLAVGGVVSGCTLAIVPFTAVTLALPFIGRATPILGTTVEPGWPAVGWAAGGLALLAALVAMAAGAGELLARLAPVLLGPTPAERLAAAEQHARTLAERNRLARELHDSVGHALSVVTLQAAAAGRVLDRDPETVRGALSAIEQSARTALEDLDHVLGLLRDDAPADAAPPRSEGDGRDPARAQEATAAHHDPAVRRDAAVRDGVTAHHDPVVREGVAARHDATGQQGEAGRQGATGRQGEAERQGEAAEGRGRPVRAPVATLADLGELVTASGAQVRQEVGDLSAVPAVVSREAYRIVQEALTNAIKHGHGPVRLRAAVQGDDLRLEITNPGAGKGSRSGGRGVTGMRERVRLLRGELEAGPTETGWKVTVRLPLRSSP